MAACNAIFEGPELVLTEIDPIEIAATELEPGHELALAAEQPHRDAVLLSHFEVTELSPRINHAALTDLRVEQLSYLVAPAPLALLLSEQRRSVARAEQQALRRMSSLLPLLGSRRVHQLIRPDRRATRVTTLDVVWRPRQPLIATIKNLGAELVTSVTIELVLYSLDASTPTSN